MAIYGVKPKVLKDFATTKKDQKKGISRMPLETNRLHQEDLVKEESATLVESNFDNDYSAMMEDRIERF